MKELLRQFDDVSRRAFVIHVARAFLCVTMVPVFGDSIATGATRTR